jgi:hypothetical protein
VGALGDALLAAREPPPAGVLGVQSAASQEEVGAQHTASEQAGGTGSVHSLAASQQLAPADCSSSSVALWEAAAFAGHAWGDARAAGAAVLGTGWPSEAAGQLHPGAAEPLATLEGLSTAEACAVVGGAQGMAYMLPRLLAAAAWKAHLEQVCRMCY